MPADKNQKLDHLLHALYYLQHDQGMHEVPLSHPEVQRHDGGTASELQRQGLAVIENGNIRLTERGLARAADVVRRHRLAERLMTDVLGLEPDRGEHIVSEMEHIVSSDLERSICTLLGHPTECPHGNPIPPGPCCEEGERAVEPAVVPLTDLRPGERGVIAYLCSRAARPPGRGPHGPRWRRACRARPGPPPHCPAGNRIARLTALGVFPGDEIEVVQTMPAFVVRVGETMLALDPEVAAAIRVRRSKRGR